VEDSSEATIELIEPTPEVRQAAPPPPPPPRPPVEKVASPESAAEIDLAEEYELVLSPEPETVEPAKTPVSNAALSSDQFLSDLADEIDKLGIGELTPSFSEPTPKQETQVAAVPKAEVPVTPGENAPLKEVFDEFRADLGEMGAEDEDLETHYNLGI